MPFSGHLFGRGKAFTLGCVYMQHLGASHILDCTQCTHQIDDVVAIYGAKVADVHPLKDVLLLGKKTLHAIIEADDTFTIALLHQA